MRKIILAIIALLAFSLLSTNESSAKKTIAKKAASGWKLEISEVGANKLFRLVFKEFKNGKEFKIMTVNDKSFLYGEDEKTIYKIDLTNENDVLVLNTKAFGESCSGVNCSKCEFAKEGGCNCTKAGTTGSAYCNHSISSIELTPEDFGTIN